LASQTLHNRFTGSPDKEHPGQAQFTVFYEIQTKKKTVHPPTGGHEQLNVFQD
jgi:hypothetical protein